MSVGRRAPWCLAAMLVQVCLLLAHSRAAIANPNLLRPSSGATFVSGDIPQSGRPSIREEALGQRFCEWKILYDGAGEMYRKRNYRASEFLFRQALASLHGLAYDGVRAAYTYHQLALAVMRQDRLREAEEYLKRSLDLSSRAKSATCPDRILARQDLANLYVRTGRAEEAIKLYQEQIKADERILGRDHDLVLLDLNDLAALYDATNMTERSLPLFEKMVAVRERKRESPDRRLILMMVALAKKYEMHGQLHKAISLYERLLIVVPKVHGPHDDQMRHSLFALGQLHMTLGEHKTAEVRFRQCLEECQRLPKPDYAVMAEGLFHLGMTHHNHADIYGIASEYKVAEHYYRRALAIQARIDSPTSQSHCNILNKLGLVFLYQKKFAEAEQVLKTSLVIAVSDLGSAHALDAFTNLAIAYRTQGRWHLAEAMLQDVISRTIRQGHYPAGAVDRYRETVAEHAHWLMQHKRDQEAGGLCHRAIAFLNTAVKPLELRDGAADRVLMPIGQLYYSAREHDAAKAKFLEYLAVYKRVPGLPAENLSEVLFQLGMTHHNHADIYHVRDEYKIAEDYYRQAIQACERAHGWASPALCRMLNKLGMVLLHQRALPQAGLVLDRSLAISLKASRFNAPETLECLTNMVHLYRLQRRWELGESIFQKNIHLIVKKGHKPDGAVERYELLVRMHAGDLMKRGQKREAVLLYQQAASFLDTALGPKNAPSARLRAEIARVLSHKSVE